MGGSRSVVGQTSARSTRVTRQRIAVQKVLSEVGEFQSAQDLHQLLRERGAKVGLATVYRTLQAMADAGEVDVMRLASGESLFRRCSDGHHHHLVCRSCGAAVEVEDADMEAWATRVAAEHGYTQASHTIEIFGLCPDCGP